jgi:GT2 family glycosyltransferase
MPRISVVVCSCLPVEDNRHSRNIARTIGCEYEYIRIDNTNGYLGISAAYNQGAKQAKGELIVFVHEDVFFMEPGWGSTLLQKLGADPELGLIGVAGTQYLSGHSAFWPQAGRPFIRGRVIHEIEASDKFFMTIYHREMADAEVVAVDGLFMAIRASLFEHIQFDAHTFDRFDLYDMDICMQIGRTHKLLVTWDILLKHRSDGRYKDCWREYADLFLEKYRSELPRSCVAEVPPINNPDTFECYDLKGKVSQATIL